MVNTDISAATLLELMQDKLKGISPVGLAPLMTLTGEMPPFSENILELHFDRFINNVDFAPRISKQFDDVLIPGYRLPFAPYSLRRLIEEDHGIENIWIEYDTPFTRPPALFFDPYRQAAFCPQTVYSCLQQIAGCLNYPLTTRLLPFLEQVQKLELRVMYYGCMFSRNTASIRLTIHGMTPQTISMCLHQLGWSGNYRVLKHLCSAYLHTGQQLVIGVDLADSLSARIGIEVFDKDPGTFIHTLYANGRINACHAALLARWPGCRLLPEHVSRQLEQLQHRPADRLYTRINHFKFIVDDTELANIKGYLYYCY